MHTAKSEKQSKKLYILHDSHNSGKDKAIGMLPVFASVCVSVEGVNRGQGKQKEGIGDV